jgi:hypothetical protein
VGKAKVGDKMGFERNLPKSDASLQRKLVDCDYTRQVYKKLDGMVEEIGRRYLFNSSNVI